MGQSEDTRWMQRLDHFRKALKTLEDASSLAQSRPLSNLEKQGLIKSFEFTHELAWNLLKGYLEYQGIMGIVGSRDAIREAFQKGLIHQGDVWMSTIKSRNLSSHTYNEKTADSLYQKILVEYLPLFRSLETKMSELSHGR